MSKKQEAFSGAVIALLVLASAMVMGILGGYVMFAGIEHIAR